MILDWIFIRFGTQLTRSIYNFKRNDQDKGLWKLKVFGKEYIRIIK